MTRAADSASMRASRKVYHALSSASLRANPQVLRLCLQEPAARVDGIREQGSRRSLPADRRAKSRGCPARAKYSGRPDSTPQAIGPLGASLAKARVHIGGEGRRTESRPPKFDTPRVGLPQLNQAPSLALPGPVQNPPRLFQVRPVDHFAVEAEHACAGIGLERGDHSARMRDRLR